MTKATSSRAFWPSTESCEGRTLSTVIFILNGASFAATGPSPLTAEAAGVLQHGGNRVVQVSYPTINSVTAYHALTRRVVRMARGQEIGLVGFSAGGALALYIAETPDLKVEAVLDFYGVPDVRAYLQRHSTDHFVRPISGLAPFRNSMVSLLSGPITTSTSIIAAFGQFDPHVQADTSKADLLADDPTAHVYTYAGGHGVSIRASRAALDDFLSHV